MAGRVCKENQNCLAFVLVRGMIHQEVVFVAGVSVDKSVAGDAAR